MSHPVSSNNMSESIKTYHGNEASYELEVLEVVRVDVGRRVDLQTVVVFASILKQTIHGVQDFMRKQKEPFPEDETIREETNSEVNHEGNYYYRKL